MDFDTIIRGGMVATAADIFAADVGIAGGRVTGLGTDLAGAPEIIDATGLLVLPGGIDSHVHPDQPAAALQADRPARAGRSKGVHILQAGRSRSCRD